MKPLIEFFENMSWRDLLGLACRFTVNFSSNYCQASSEVVREFDNIVSSSDLEIALPTLYSQLVKSENQISIKNELTYLLRKLETEIRNPRDCIFNDLGVIQEVLAKALWGYDMPLMDELEEFARKFERIDDERERERIIAGYANISS